MRDFQAIFDLAAQHHGGAAAVEAKLPAPKIPAELRADPDDRWLSRMTQAVFQSGFSWKVIEAKWPGFEAAFDGFDPRRVAMYSDDDIARLLGDARIVRNGVKIAATVKNAQFVCDMADEHGSFGAFLAGWPPADQAGLMELFKTRASHLSGSAGQYFLRFSGWDAFILSKDVVKALAREGVIDGPPGSKKAMAAVQTAFAQWSEQSGRPQAAISRILAMSVG